MTLRAKSIAQCALTAAVVYCELRAAFARGRRLGRLEGLAEVGAKSKRTYDSAAAPSCDRERE